MANIHNNVVIAENDYGIKCFNNSKLSIKGDRNAIHVSQTQKIIDNSKNQIFATQMSFPYYLRWNAIYDDNYSGQPLYPFVSYTGDFEKITFNIANNFWGTNFNPVNSEYYFFPIEYYKWEPYWILQTGPPPTSDDEILYESAMLKISDEDYMGATDDLHQIISDYPNSNFAQASLNDLLSIEKYVSGDYQSLKTFLLSDTTILNNELLNKISKSLANWCDVYSENYTLAIGWFEDVIQNPESFEDSIFAIIDLGYTYWLMENSGLKSTYTGMMPQYKFSSQKDYVENRDYLLSLLPGDGLSETMKQSLSTLKTGELLQNVPNPFNGTTQIWFKLAEESNVSVTIYDYTGKEVSVINPGTLKTSNHSVEFNSANLSSGIYFYSLEVNGIKTDAKKMTLMR